ncbi:uncharacterized protein LOC128263876 [Drosophila gunungcola]|uniref:uncharacterized protein LOC128263876 n=1 Tax=Drosophila gunungcola TaxID=103775 RepID=UPI0022E5CA9C|nr:uncharacterized protein LOC128263876 [Drosophila gunungcola]
MHTAIDIDASLRRIWEPDVNQELHRKPENDEVEQQFLKTHTRDPKGRHIVELPFKDPNKQFSDTLQGALARFNGVERRLMQDPNLRSQYVKFMHEYLNLDHMQELSPEDIDKKPNFYLPHHPISAVVNSIPLCYTPDTDLTYLSPAHYLIGRPFTTVPEGDLTHLPINRMDYWQHLQSMYRGFWKRWHQECLTSLQQRHKWKSKKRNISVDNFVLVKDSNLPPAAWQLARVLEAHPGPDGFVRAVKLKTSTGKMTRPITMLAVLPSSETVFQGGPGC